MNTFSQIVSLKKAECIQELCLELIKLALDSQRLFLVTLTLESNAGLKSLKTYLGISQSCVVSSKELLHAIEAVNGGTPILLFCCMICGMAGRVVHSCFTFASQRKISGKLLIDHPMAMIKLAELATHEAILCLRHDMLLSNPSDTQEENVKEICRCALQISSQSMDLRAGNAFVQADASQSDRAAGTS